MIVLSFRNNRLIEHIQNTGFKGCEHGLYYDNGRYVYNPYDFTPSFASAEGEVLNYE